MRRYLGLFMVLLAFTGIACPPAPKVEPINKDIVKTTPPPPPPANLEALRPRLETALQLVRERDLQADHGFWTVFHGILGTGLDKTMLRHPKTKKQVNAIEYICSGEEMPGLDFIPTRHGLDVRTVSPLANMELEFIAQGHQDQFIAEMAQWGMKLDQKFKVGGKDYTFADFVNHCKMRTSVTKDQELSWAIIIIAQFYGTDYSWTNGDGETVRFTDVVKYELNQPVSDKAACGGTHRLFGLTWAYHLHLKNGGKKESVWLDVERKIADFKQRAKKNQQADGNFSIKHFEPQPDKLDREPDTALRISTSGHVLEWLALAMTDEELRSPWMQSAVSGVSQLILNMQKARIDGGALYHAAHGLHIYHERVYGTPAKYLAVPPR